jgi:hypothetical protein
MPISAAMTGRGAVRTGRATGVRVGTVLGAVQVAGAPELGLGEGSGEAGRKETDAGDRGQEERAASGATEGNGVHCRNGANRSRCRKSMSQ